MIDFFKELLRVKLTLIAKRLEESLFPKCDISHFNCHNWAGSIKSIYSCFKTPISAIFGDSVIFSFQLELIINIDKDVMGFGVMNNIKFKFLIENICGQNLIFIRISPDLPVVIRVCMNHKSCTHIHSAEDLEYIYVVGSSRDSNVSLELLSA